MYLVDMMQDRRKTSELYWGNKEIERSMEGYKERKRGCSRGYVTFIDGSDV